MCSLHDGAVQWVEVFLGRKEVSFPKGGGTKGFSPGGGADRLLVVLSSQANPTALPKEKLSTSFPLVVPPSVPEGQRSCHVDAWF